MVYNIRSFFLNYVTIIVICLSYTFAPWKKMPETPTIGTLGSCFNWLMYHGFRNNNIKNQEWALDREREFDQYVSYFAAAYAYVLSNSSELYNIDYFGPIKFCLMHTIDFVTYTHVPLKDAEFICEGWIDLYIYNEDRDESKTNNPSYISNVFDSSNSVHYDPSDSVQGYYRNKKYDNFIWARNRELFMDNKISLWAALYFKYITFDLQNALTTPRDICNLLGKPVTNEPLPKRFPFMTLTGLKMSCFEWLDVSTSPIGQDNTIFGINSMRVEKLPFTSIRTECYDLVKQHGFTDDSSKNYEIVSSVYNGVDINNVNLFVKTYVTYLQEWYSINNENLMTLKQFCKTWDFDDAQLLCYYGLMQCNNKNIKTG